MTADTTKFSYVLLHEPTHPLIVLTSGNDANVSRDEEANSSAGRKTGDSRWYAAACN